MVYFQVEIQAVAIRKKMCPIHTNTIYSMNHLHELIDINLPFINFVKYLKISKQGFEDLACFSY